MKIITPKSLSLDKEKEIAELINHRNKLTTRYTSAMIKRIVSDPERRLIAETTESDELMGVIEVHRVSWYQCEFKHLSVKDEYEGKGVGSRLADEALREAKLMDAKIVQCTIRKDNTASAHIFEKHGFKCTLEFINDRSGNLVRVYQFNLTAKAQ